MAQFRDDLLDLPISVNGDRLDVGLQLTVQLRGNADRIPVQFRIAVAKSTQLALRQIMGSVQALPGLYQERMPLDLRQLAFRIPLRSAPVPEGIKDLFIGPMATFLVDDGKSLPDLLTSGKRLVQIIRPLSRQRVWPPATTVVDDAFGHCSTVAWLYGSRPRDFSCRAAPLSGCARHRCFHTRKVPVR